MNITQSGTSVVSTSLTNIEAIRFLIGDIQADVQLVTNSQITWALSEETTIYGASALLAEGLSSYFATQADLVKIGPIWEQYTKRSTDYSAKAKALRNKASSKSELNIYAGGLDTTGKLTNELDTSLVQPNFAIGMTDREDI